jgi:hypothetical protein
VIILSAVTQARSALAIATRYRGADHPDTRAAKLDLERAKLAELVDKAEAQRARVAELQGQPVVVKIAAPSYRGTRSDLINALTDASGDNP